MNNYPPLRNGEKWREYEDNGLLYELQKGKNIGEIAYKHHRTIGGITSRIKKIAENMLKNNENIDDIINTTKLSKEEIQKIINKKEEIQKIINKKEETEMMTNGSWNKKKISNKEQHIQNMKDELFMMKNGYWLKTQDKIEDLDREYELKKFKQLQRGHPSQFKYVSKSKYPKIIMKALNDPPEFKDDLYNDNLQPGQTRFSIIDKIDNNRIEYAYINYQQQETMYRHKSQMIDAYNEQLKIKIKSLESMIYLFENM